MAGPADYFPAEEFTRIWLHTAPLHRLSTRVFPSQHQGEWAALCCMEPYVFKTQSDYVSVYVHMEFCLFTFYLTRLIFLQFVYESARFKQVDT